MADSSHDPTPGDSSNGTPLPLRPALKPEEETLSPRSGPAKVVSIAEPEDLDLHQHEEHRKRQHVANLGKRITGRPPPVISSHTSPRLNALSHATPDEHHSERERLADYRHLFEALHEKTKKWIHAERDKLKGRGDGHASAVPDFEKLLKILDDSKTPSQRSSISLPSPALSGPSRPSLLGHKRSSSRLYSRASSDTEYHDGDVVVPNCDVMLDNTKTLSYSGGTADDNASISSKKADKERKAWATFKTEIVKLTHTLKLKGWRRVPLERSIDIDVERLSGAMTNAVYVVAPPKDLPPPASGHGFKKAPPKLLLRIYGPQVEHLIDRENELGILRRLARKKIGPRLLGTFRNGRFEEFFNATTLTSPDLRVPETSKQIAKRMRELHEGVELLEKERDAGPFVWCNWDRWVDRVEKVISYLDKQILAGKTEIQSPADNWKKRGFVCGVEWPVFKAVVYKYRQWLVDSYGGPEILAKRLVFAHNDTQYGNILRLKPAGESPLLLPANEHKQLVVIDFEYASANTPGLEFANHFTEWCYNYHDAVAPHACNHHGYPTVEEQRRFIRSYVNHRPSFNPKASSTPSQTPKLGASGPSSSVSNFMLDARYPSGTIPTDDAWREEEEKREKAVAEQVEKLRHETRIWRVANSAQWVSWGIVQATVPGVDDTPEPSPANELKPHLQSDELSPDVAALKESHDHDQRPEGSLVADALRSGEILTPEQIAELEEAEAGEEEFDYLGYAQERALFFWGDVVQLGIVKREELPASLLDMMKVVEY